MENHNFKKKFGQNFLRDNNILDKIANSFENITHLAFGVETKKPEILIELANFFLNEPKQFKTAIKKHLNEGNSLVVSRQKALEDMVMTDKAMFSEITEAVNILNKPNNILAIEYLCAIKKLNSKIMNHQNFWIYK